MSQLDRRALYAGARRALDRGQHEEAISTVFTVIDRFHGREEELRVYLELLAVACEAAGRTRAAAAAHLYLDDIAQAMRLSEGHAVDTARCYVRAGQARRAAAELERAGWLGHAAIQLENSGDDRAARVLWERLSEAPALRADPYTLGLVKFNLSRAAARLGDRSARRRAAVESMHLLQAAADELEQRGLRERAFDCYQILLSLGRDGAFENLAEGYLNCIRILREDNLRYYVLQYYEDFQALALARGELSALATLFREAADFSRRHDLPYEAHYRKSAADTHVSAAEKTLREGGPVELVENAYAAAIDALNELGLYSRVSEVYGALERLPLSEKRKARYARLRVRLAGVPDQRQELTTFPDYLRMETAYPEIWRLDVIEWEQKGDAAETMAEVLSDPKWPEFTRRRAMTCRLYQLSAGDPPLSPATLAQLAVNLGRVEIYAALAPLEHLYQHEQASVRASVLRAVRQLFFKRSFGLVTAGLGDPDASVRREALAAVSQLHFGHAFDPLARIYRDATDPSVRKAALASIGKIPTVEAVEMLIDVLRHSDHTERELAVGLLARADQAEVTGLLRRALGHETGAAKVAMEKALRTRAR